MLSVAIHKDISEYEPKIIGKMTLRTLVSITGAVGCSIVCALYLYFVLGLMVGDYMMIIYAVSLPFWSCGFIRPCGMPFEKFVPLWFRARFTDDRIFYVPTLRRLGLVPPLGAKKGRIYGKHYRKQQKLNGIEAYSPRVGRVIL